MRDDYAANKYTTGILLLGGAVTGNIDTVVDGVADIDWLSITLAAGQRVEFNLEGSDSGQGTLGDPVLAGIYDSSGAIIANTFNDDNGTNHNARLAFTAQAAGDYYVAVAAATACPGATGSYRLRAMAIAADDLSANIGTAGVLAIGGHANGNIETPCDADWFKIALVAGQQIRFDLEGCDTTQGTLADPLLRGIYDGNGVLIANTGNDDNGTTHNASVLFTAPSNGDYYVSATAFEGATGSYRLGARIAVDDFGANIATRGQLHIGGTATGNIDSVGDADWFKIAVVAGNQVQIDLEGSASGQGTLDDPSILGIYDSNGVLVADTANDDFGGTCNARVIFKTWISGDYYIAAGGYRSHTGTYRLSAIYPPVDDFASSIATTGSVGFGGFVRGNIEVPNDVDWFRIALNAGQEARFDPEGMFSGQGTIYSIIVRGIYDQCGRLLPNTNGYGGVNFIAPDTGNYYVAVASIPDRASIGSYRLNAGSPAADDFAANPATVGTLSLGVEISGRIESIGDADWFKINLGAGQQVQFDQKGGHPSPEYFFDPRLLGVFDSGGSAVACTTIDDSDSRGNSRIVLVAPHDGDYFVSASASGVNTGTYQLIANTVIDDFVESPATTGRLSLGGFVTGNIEMGGDIDWFRISLNANQLVQLDLEGSATNQGTLDNVNIWYIYDSSGKPIDDTLDYDIDANSSARVSFIAPSTGDYYVGARGSYRNTGSYLLSASTPTADDYGADTATLGRLALGGYANGTIDAAGDADWFKIALVAGQHVQFDLEGSDTGQGTLDDTFLRGILDDSGKLLAFTTNDNNDLSRNSRVSFTVPSTGDYYVSAGAPTFYIGTYRLGAALTTDDFAADQSTTGHLSFGVPIVGNIENPDDTDWFKITVAARQQVKVDVEGSSSGAGTLAHPRVLGIVDSGGTRFYTAYSLFTSLDAGDYFISVGNTSLFGRDSGTYRIGVTLWPDDFAADTSTTGRLSVGSSTTGTIESSNNPYAEADWFKIALSAGQKVQFDLEGNGSGQGTLDDPLIQGIYDSSGTLFANTTNDNVETTLNSRVVFTAPSSGDYYVAASAQTTRLFYYAGTYRLSATACGSALGAGDATSPALGGNANFGSEGHKQTVDMHDWVQALSDDVAVHLVGVAEAYY